ncbi:MAG: hypothetical protein A2750_03195 [Candidatus Yanofskybacteria bacterium RIFCSPHIGHO2_01_FULL_45_42]|uniref:Uncharacterized protein n=2 Tax=Candidatus Yanofskyibacteriota TaxID=1752733 RepID=A0A1F8FPY1_9BACT|nr:MAG: hypothetical protein A2750_03195 [Candidatus Yanofskybacteria bacterium RIFCSPHIGHO2_01_FULL_45_42]OGN15217.1 MAG: hypothetical protein A3J47_03575 [Candidatus Yanofskybacteria bacterium RIFCSPHIGHO2_02_FULL_43_22]
MGYPIYLIESKTRQDLAATFMRFQEYYESPVFRGRAFSADEFAAWYASELGAFTYCQDWAGFNIPSWVLEPFRNGGFDPLTDRENNLLNFFKNVGGNFYIIGATSQDKECADTIKHEFVHGAFFTNGDYRRDVINCLNAHKPGVVKVALREMGYGENVIEDETNAYLLTEPQTFGNRVSLNEGLKLRNILDKIFAKYFGFSMAVASADCVANRTERILI